MGMRRVAVLLVAVLMLALGGCVKRGPQVVQQQEYAPTTQSAQPIAAAPAPVVYAAPADQAPVSAVATAAPAPPPRGFFTANLGGPFARAPAYASPPCGTPGCGAAPVYLEAAFEQPYLLDAGDRLRITVFGQDGLTNSYAVDAAGNVTMPLVGGIGPRADRSKITLSRTIGGQTTRASVPLSYPLRPGDTLRIDERWF